MQISPEHATANLITRLRSGDVRALARAISLVENAAPESTEILSGCFPFTGRALRIGVTGAPGAGKSTLVDRLARGFREAGQTVGIIAVDPTSPFSGGAILGDRIRLREQPGDPGTYIRSMATRGTLGGLARATADVASVIEASGKDVILIETVGVGQDEIEIARLADITLVVLVPGMGDDVQSLKAGVMEIADIFVVNKADREGAERVEAEIRAMQSLAGSHEDPRTEWIASVVKTVATTGDGLRELEAAIAEFHAWLSQEDRLNSRRKSRWQTRISSMLQSELLRRAASHGFTSEKLEDAAARIARGEENPWKLIPQLAEQLFGRHATAETITIDHLGIAVKSIAAARAFYKTIGLTIGHEETVAQEKVRAAMIQAGESRLELLEPLEADSPIGKFLAKRGEGLHHVALHVPDIEVSLARLKAQGVRLVSDRIQTGAGGHLYFFVHPSSAGGVLLEICQDRKANA